jgi:virulence-associated protein VapD
MSMEIVFNENKLKEQNLVVDNVNSFIIEVCNSTGINKKEGDLFIGNNDSQDFANFGKIVLKLKELNWFLSSVDKWFLYEDDDEEDLAEYYKKKLNIA